MDKRAFLESVVIRCASMPGAQPGFTILFAVQMWEALEKYGEQTGDQIAAQLAGPGQGLTGPRSPLS